MKYLKWFLLAIVDVLFNAVCYLTNPIVLLFADELGNLPRIFLWWANWDDHLDVDWMVYGHHVPKFAEYDFNRHYKYITSKEAEQTIGEYRAYVILLDPHFTTWERFQRYVCRLTWMYRNCAYGFSYYVTGIMVNEEDIRKIINEKAYIYYVTDYAFCFKYDRPSYKNFRWKIFLGWKFQNVHGTKRCMLAFCINPWK